MFMRIVICASIDFSDKIKDVYDKLIKQGHEIDLPLYTLKIIKGEITLEEYKKIKEKEGDINLRKKQVLI